MKQAGFTIIELIVVIAIIAILAAIVVTNVIQYIDKSRRSAVLVNLSQISIEATKIMSENGDYGGLCDNMTNNIIKSFTDIGYNLGACADIDSYPNCPTDRWVFYTCKNGSDAIGDCYCIDAREEIFADSYSSTFANRVEDNCACTLID